MLLDPTVIVKALNLGVVEMKSIIVMMLNVVTVHVHIVPSVAVLMLTQLKMMLKEATVDVLKPN